MTVEFLMLLVVSYILGSVPASFLAAKSRGIDLRRYGTGQVGAGNLLRMTHSYWLTVPVAIFDLGKGALMIWVAQLFGLPTGQQLAMGIAAIIGHNWPVFLRFNGGRGIGTMLGVVVGSILISHQSLWVIAAFLGIIAIGIIIIRTTAIPVLVALAALPLISWGFGQPLSTTLGFLAIFLIVVIRRLTAPKSPEVSIGKKELLLNRFLHDRDIKDRGAWVYRKPEEQEKPGKK
jgi:glycerol-3-phosphate acyltransferase PlsY